MDNYPAGVTDADPYFDMPSVGDGEDDGPLCLGCHGDLEVDTDGYCADCNDELDEL